MVTNEEKQELLSKIDFRQEYERIGVVFDQSTPGPDGWLQCHAIDREDHSPSAAVNLTNGYYTDLGSGQRFDFFQMMQVKGGYSSFLDVVDHYRKELGISPAPKKRGSKPKSPEAEVDLLPWDGTGDYWCKLKSTNRSAVERAGGVICRYKKLHSCVGFQVFANPTGQASGYVVLSTDGKELPRFDRSGNLLGTSKCKIVAGTVSGLIGTETLATIQKARQEGTLDEITLFKVEGITDMTALLARIPEEKRGKWLVVTNASGAGEKPKHAWADLFDGVNTVVIHDCDTPGQDGAKNWCNFLKGTAGRVRNVVLPYEMTPNHGRDLKDFLTEHSFGEFEELVAGTPDVIDENTNEPEPNDPYRIARLFLKENYEIPDHAMIYSLVFQQGTYFCWHDGYYCEMPSEGIKAAVTQYTEKLFYEDFQEQIKNATGSESPRKLKVTRNLVADVMNAIEAIVYCQETEDLFWRGSEEERPKEFENLDFLIPFRNGILDFLRLEKEWKEDNSKRNWNDYLMPTTPLLFNRYVFDFDYNGNAKSEKWEKLIIETLVDETDREKDWSKYYFLQEFFGYCLTPDASLHQFLILLGEGGNGKSAVLTGFSTMIGQSNISNIPLEQFDDKFALIHMRGKLVNIVDDLSDTGSTCEGKLKSIVSGQTISSDRKNKSQVSFEPTARLLFACNTLPRLRDKSNGIFRRLTILRFNKTIPESKKRPKLTTKKFWKKEVQGIFNWCLDGLLHLRCDKNVFVQCHESDSIKDEFQRDTNPALRFFDEYVETDPNEYVPLEELYEAYRKWCGKKNYKPMTDAMLGREVKKRFSISRDRKTIQKERVYIYPGLKLLYGHTFE